MFCCCPSWFSWKSKNSIDYERYVYTSPCDTQPVGQCENIVENKDYNQDCNPNCNQDCNPNCNIYFTLSHDKTIKSLNGKVKCGVEEVRVFHCNIPDVNEVFPSSVKTIKITFSGVKRFSTCVLPSGISQIDLSFNKLQEIPDAIFNAFIKNPSISINLKNNDFWFSMYSNINPSLVSPKTVNELMKAHRMNLISTNKVHYAIHVLKEKKFNDEAQMLAERIGEQVKLRVNDGGCTWENKENVHYTSVQDSLKDSIDKLNSISTSKSNDTVLSIIQDVDLRKHVENDLQTYYDYASLVQKVYEVALKFGVDLKIIEDELRDGMVDTCLTGKIRRIVSVLNGFVPGLYIGISKNEEIANSIIVIRNRNAKLYENNTELYITETTPEVLQILEDACIPLHEQTVWIEYI